MDGPSMDLERSDWDMVFELMPKLGVPPAYSDSSYWGIP